jgi:hypothetical protein
LKTGNKALPGFLATLFFTWGCKQPQISPTEPVMRQGMVAI